jgi:hypothetical protein
MYVSFYISEFTYYLYIPFTDCPAKLISQPPEQWGVCSANFTTRALLTAHS